MSDRAAEVRAVDVLLAAARIHPPHEGWAPLVAALLACTPDGEPVVITAEGRLMRLELARKALYPPGAPDLYRLTPLEPSPKETGS